ncbi:holin [Thermus phage G20c]|nr:holin [Thermus phage G20c]
MDILDVLTKPEVATVVGVLLVALLPRQVWELIPPVRAALQVLDAGYKAYESRKKAEALEAAAKAAQEAVKGTEQLIIKSGQLTKEVAKAQAVSFLMSNFGLDQGTAELLVEKAVLELKR